MDRLVFWLDFISSDDMRIFANARQQIKPSRTPKQVKVNGKHGLITFKGSTFDNRLIFLDCIFIANSREEAIKLWHEAAEWLSRENVRIEFSDDPEWYYIGTCFNAAELNDMHIAGEFTLAFDCEPFAKGKEHSAISESYGETITRIDYTGNVPTCPVFVLKNSGNTPISNIKFTKTQRR